MENDFEVKRADAGNAGAFEGRALVAPSAYGLHRCHRVSLTLDPQTITAQIILEARVQTLASQAVTPDGVSELAKLRRALARIEEGSWGLCERCQVAIGRGRLRAIPEATECLQCANREA